VAADDVQARLRCWDIANGCSVTTGAPVGVADAFLVAIVVLPIASVLSSSEELCWAGIRCGAGLAPLPMLDVLSVDEQAAHVAGRAMKVVVLPRPRRPAFCLPFTCVNISSSSEPRSASKAACRRRSALRDMLTRSGKQYVTVLSDPAAGHMAETLLDSRAEVTSDELRR
jgi:hypothetical protein